MARTNSCPADDLKCCINARVLVDMLNAAKFSLSRRRLLEADAINYLSCLFHIELTSVLARNRRGVPPIVW